MVLSDEKQHTLQALFELQQAYAPQLAQSGLKERKAKLRRILDFLFDEQNVQALDEALWADFRKPRLETYGSEIGIVVTHAKYILRHLSDWMRPRPVATPLPLLGTTSYQHFEPKGNCLIIAPWNYPFNLAVMPALYAIAAGNTVVIKPSELTPHCSAYIRRMMNHLFDERELAVVEGGAETAEALTELPFNHIHFTGSPRVGSLVMRAAARHLSSVTLELGGKSPAIVDEKVNIRQAAKGMVWSKYYNGGQTCIATDYAIVHESVKEEFIAAFRQSIERMYNPDGRGIEYSPDLARIVNDSHFERVRALYEDAMAKGAKLEAGGRFIAEERFIAPTVLSNVDESMAILREEIFGPILPVLTYRHREEIVEIVNRRPKALIMYINSRDQGFIRHLIHHTSAGNTMINEYLLSFAQPALPFGGINNSGIGKSFGFHGFREFSNERGIMRRHWGTFSFIYPPYSGRVRGLLKTLVKNM